MIAQTERESYSSAHTIHKVKCTWTLTLAVDNSDKEKKNLTRARRRWRGGRCLINTILQLFGWGQLSTSLHTHSHYNINSRDVIRHFFFAFEHPPISNIYVYTIHATKNYSFVSVVFWIEKNGSVCACDKNYLDNCADLRWCCNRLYLKDDKEIGSKM